MFFDPNKAEILVVLTPVTPDKDWPDGIKFELVSNLKEGDKLVFHNDGRPGFDLDFLIVDTHNTGYLFPDNEKDAMWVKVVNSIEDKCPNSEMYWRGFKATEVKTHNQVLRVRNRNDAERLFKFALRFTKTPRQNSPCILFDPIGSNRNGAGLASAFKAIGIGAALVLVGALAGYCARRD